MSRQNGVPDASLVVAIERARNGLIDADLGGLIIKQRVAQPGQGKRSGFRMLIGFKPDRSVFLFGFAKNERENINDAELTTPREIAGSFLNATEERILQALKDGNSHRGAIWQRIQESRRQQLAI